MALKAKSRSALFDKLSPIVGDEEVVDDLLAQFPARDLDEPITRDYLRAELGVSRAETASEFAAVRAEMANEFAAVRAEMANEFAAVRAEIAEHRTEVERQLAAAHRRTVNLMVGLAALVISVNTAALGAAVAILR